MSIDVTCPHCLAHLKIKEKYAGRQGACPNCKGPLAIPAASAGAAAAGTAPQPPTAVPQPPVVAPQRGWTGDRPASSPPAPPSGASAPTDSGAAAAGDSILFRCDLCGRQLRAARQYAGRPTRCTGCGQVLTIPGTAAASWESARGSSAPYPASVAPPGVGTATVPGGNYDLMSDLDQELRSAGRASSGDDGGYGVDLGELESAAAAAPAAPAPSRKKKVASLGKGKRRPGVKIGFNASLINIPLAIGPFVLVGMAYVSPPMLVPVDAFLSVAFIITHISIVAVMFQHGQGLLAAMGLFCCCSPIVLVQGWRYADEWRIGPLMFVFSSTWAASIILNFGMRDAAEKAWEEYFASLLQPTIERLEGDSHGPRRGGAVQSTAPQWPIHLAVPIHSIDFSQENPPILVPIHERIVSDARGYRQFNRPLDGEYELLHTACNDCIAVLERITDLETARKFAPALLDEIDRLALFTITLYAAKAVLPEHDRRVLPGTRRQANADMYAVGEAYDRAVKTRGVKTIFEQELRRRKPQTQYLLSSMHDYDWIVTFVAAHGPDNIAVVFLVSRTPGTNWDPYYKSLSAIADNGAGHLLKHAENDYSTVMVAPVADIDAFRDRIHFSHNVMRGLECSLYVQVGDKLPGGPNPGGAGR